MGFLGDWWQSMGARQSVKLQTAQTGAESAKAAGGMIGDVTGTFKGGPGSYLGRQSEAVDSIAQKEAATSADLATKQAVRGAKTAGMMGGQAALAASRQAADAYSGSLANARQGLRDQYSQAAGMQTGAMGALAGIGDLSE